MITGESLEWLTASMSFRTKDLLLENSVFDHEVMTPFLRCFPSLKRLSYNHGGALTAVPVLEPPKIIEAFEHLKPCLEKLIIISFEPYTSFELGRFPIASLADSQKLTLTETTISVLLGDSYQTNIDSPPRLFKPQQRFVEAIPPRLEWCHNYISDISKKILCGNQRPNLRAHNQQAKVRSSTRVPGH
jgi:hypothetical protein